MKINLGASRLEKLSKESLDVMLKKDWLHLGEDTLNNPNNRPLEKVDYSKTNFESFYWSRGDSLTLEDNSSSFIYSEHFFEHLFLDEAIDLFKECYRILEPNGVLRIVVPDADLRSVPEILGYPDINLPNDSPRKHKTRWSYYNLNPVLNLSGFDVVPIIYFDKFGVQHISDLNNHFERNNYVLDRDLIESLSYVRRKNSLILDGVKRDV